MFGPLQPFWAVLVELHVGREREYRLRRRHAFVQGDDLLVLFDGHGLQAGHRFGEAGQRRRRGLRRTGRDERGKGSQAGEQR